VVSDFPRNRMKRHELIIVCVILAIGMEIGWCSENDLVNHQSPSDPQLTPFWRQHFIQRLLKKRQSQQQQRQVNFPMMDQSSNANLRFKRFDPRDRELYARPGPQTKYVYAQAQRYAPYEYPKWYDWHILRTNAILRTGVPTYNNVW